MAVKPTLVQLTTGNVDPTVLNSNLDILAEAIADTWDKSGTSSGNNTITGDLDLNGFTLKNIGDPDEDANSLATRGWVEANYGIAATTEAEHWANYPEDQLVPEGDLVNDYSALHWAAKAAISVTAAQLAETNAETAETNAELAETNAEAAQVAAEAAQTAAEAAAALFAGKTLLAIDVYTSNATWTKPTGADFFEVWLVGGGGGGGGVAAVGVATPRVGGNGGGGDSLYAIIADGLSTTENVVVGSGGTGSSGAAGNNGGDTYLRNASFISAGGGAGGAVDSANGASGGGISGTTLLRNTGNDKTWRLGATGGDTTLCDTTYFFLGKPGGSNGPYGSNSHLSINIPTRLASGVTHQTGYNAVSGYGCGAAPAYAYNTLTAQAGGNATGGILVIKSYITFV